MPRGDRTGPVGAGPLTGRGMGYCSGSARPGFTYPGPRYGLGRGMGLGGGRGWRRGGFGQFWGYPYPPANPYVNFQPINDEQEMDILDDQVKMLESEIKQIKRRQAELKKQQSSQE